MTSRFLRATIPNALRAIPSSEPQNRRTAELQNCRTAELLSPPRRAVLHQVIRKQGIKVNRCVPALIDAM
jgi:hypothetical protein